MKPLSASVTAFLAALPPVVHTSHNPSLRFDTRTERGCWVVSGWGRIRPIRLSN
jgi:hypothetical protein